MDNLQIPQINSQFLSKTKSNYEYKNKTPMAPRKHVQYDEVAYDD